MAAAYAQIGVLLINVNTSIELQVQLEANVSNLKLNKTKKGLQLNFQYHTRQYSLANLLTVYYKLFLHIN